MSRPATRGGKSRVPTSHRPPQHALSLAAHLDPSFPRSEGFCAVLGLPTSRLSPPIDVNPGSSAGSSLFFLAFFVSACACRPQLFHGFWLFGFGKRIDAGNGHKAPTWASPQTRQRQYTDMLVPGLVRRVGACWSVPVRGTGLAQPASAGLSVEKRQAEARSQKPEPPGGSLLSGYAAWDRTATTQGRSSQTTSFEWTDSCLHTMRVFMSAAFLLRHLRPAGTQLWNCP
ncbi:hypothetical protein FN846DRAFT_365270 [Sphaerosporella brunnea]|uniref:Uncharacterized protein n=1 Tax=Sphaerosporella brunnea TaxID=1250544 RepID=A0A5J5EIS4_9PEZI|nr:hypothetical protein FN846DRAFT_365270 [Sphaerosporella brunnea]